MDPSTIISDSETIKVKNSSGSDPGSLERGLINIKVWGSLTETNLFHFHRIFKTGEGVRANPLNPLWTRHCS